MVRAGSLIFALCISLLLLILSSALILLAYNTRSVTDNLFIDERQITNTSSALNYYFNNCSQWENDFSQDIDLFGNGTDFVTIEKKTWGLFSIVSCHAHQNNHYYNTISLTGEKAKKELTALYLCDQNKPLSLCGKTIIRGHSYLPLQGVKRAYIEGENFIGNNLIEGTTDTSQAVLPQLPSKRIYDASFLQEINQEDSVIDIESLQANKVLFNSFSNSTIILSCKTSIDLDNYQLSGNIILRSQQTINVKSGCILSDILVEGKSIIIEKNFSGNIQAFATDSIVLKEESHLNYPSILCIVINKGSSIQSKITMERNTTIGGGVLNFNSANPIIKSINVDVGENSSITGLIYSNGFVQLKGSVIGSLYCYGFILKTSAATYDNHLLNTTINADELPNYYVGILSTADTKREGLIKRLQ